MSSSVTSSLWPCAGYTLESFQSFIWDQGVIHVRDFAWRHTTDPYEILVSEVMLQQTQVSRVVKRWEEWIARFPNVDALASASVSDVLELWQGMGYNRRALNLKRACDMVSAQYGGVMPETYDELLTLPGVGPSTATGVMAFAHNKVGVYLETNVRCVFINELFPTQEKVSDKELIPYIKDACDDDNPRGWYYALLDYGAYLKSIAGKSGDASRRSSSYVRQSTFEGSFRQKRAEVLRYVLESPGIHAMRLHELINDFERKNHRDGLTDEEFDKVMKSLLSDGFFSEKDGGFFA